MKKILLVLAVIIATLMMFYGAVSALVNQGHPLGSSLLTFVLVVAGGIGLAWLARSDPGE